MSGLTLRLNQIAGHPVGDFNALAYANAGDFTDVTVGNNGAFPAAPGWDPASGLGSPVGTKVLTALTSSSASATDSSSAFAVGPSRSSATTDDGLMAAFESLRTAVDGLREALQSWGNGRRRSGTPVPSRIDTGLDPAEKVPAPRPTADTSMPEPIS
jgi:kumamolisin